MIMNGGNNHNQFQVWNTPTDRSDVAIYDFLIMALEILEYVTTTCEFVANDVVHECTLVMYSKHR